MSSAMAYAIRRALTQQAPKAARAVHTSSARAGGHGHGAEGYDKYIHAEHMYDITAMKNRNLKFALGTVALVGSGVAIPAWAVHWTQAKRMG